MNRLAHLSLPPRAGSSDLRLSLAMNRWSQLPKLRSLFVLTSRLGDGILWYALIGVLAVADGMHGLTAAHMAFVGLLNTALYTVVKRSLKRPRPYVSNVGIVAFAAPLDEFSFPSGHTMHAVAFCVILGGYFPGLLLVLAPFAALTALSRVALGLHYPSDVVLGACSGLLVALLSWTLFG